MYFLFNSIAAFHKPSQIVRYHHINYEKIKSQNKREKDEIHIGSFILRLADRISIEINKNKPILAQKENISSLIAANKSAFHPEVLLPFEDVLNRDYIWLELVSVPQEKLFERVLQESIVNMPQNDFHGLSEIIGHLIDFKSPYTAGHSHSVAVVNHWLVEKTIEFSGLENRNLFPVGFLHDIGKLAIPSDILEKPGKLDPLEWSIMRSHAYYSHVALELLYDTYPELKYAPLHHEKLDGTGYPFGLKGKEIPDTAHSLAIADVFTALTENRPYRGVMPENEVAKIMKSLKGSSNNSSKLQEDLID
ncbi:MAG TPA: HD domain-containing phosphohydrolase, partial [Candidatus Hydrogenedens sp.]|nr:HD domain-containing phosphohydrolase [Candidatus Hydrogenedens sp.]